MRKDKFFCYITPILTQPHVIRKLNRVIREY